MGCAFSKHKISPLEIYLPKKNNNQQFNTRSSWNSDEALAITTNPICSRQSVVTKL